MILMKKNCLKCNNGFQKKVNCSCKNWALSKYCSKSCANSVNSTGNTNVKGRKLSEEHKQKIRIANTRNGNRPPVLYGEDHPRWKGGVTSEAMKIRNSLKYKQWRTSVFERDDYTCTECGVRGGELNADHIKPFCKYPKLRLDLDNGRTLCVPCHRELGWSLFRENNPRKNMAVLES